MSMSERRILMKFLDLLNKLDLYEVKPATNDELYWQLFRQLGT